MNIPPNSSNHPFSACRITENGESRAHIVLFDGADPLEQYAAKELAVHIKSVSGADIPVTDAVQSDSLPIIIATPASLPELESLFPEDLIWLRDTGKLEERVRFGDDGFAIRLTDSDQADGKLYIFGATARGALNGVYDFIENNLGVLWTRAEDMADYGTIYDPMPTVSLTKVNCREKSPFDIRSWTLSGNSYETQVLLSRNKLNATALTPAEYCNGSFVYDTIGMAPFLTNHNIKWWITNSPSFDPECKEYWSTDENGEHVASSSESTQVNIWSNVTMRCIADSVLAFLDRYADRNITYVGICLEDAEPFSVYPEMTLPFEYAPGQLTEPNAANYISTVFYSLLNGVARIVAEKYPLVRLQTYAYGPSIMPPLCELEENIYLTIAPINEDLLNPLGKSPNFNENMEFESLIGWAERTPNIQIYNYYGCFKASAFFERPFWHRIQSDLQLYAKKGLNGLVPEGHGDNPYVIFEHPVFGIYEGSRKPYCHYDQSYAMNAMTYWIYAKLAWNPYEDVDALIKYYCDKAYGAASPHMQEYYRLLWLGTEYGRTVTAEEMTYLLVVECNCYFSWGTPLEIYWLFFLDVEVDGVRIIDAIAETLHKAYDAANDVQKKRLAHIVDVYDHAEELFFGDTE